jgi:hypothetical protein
MNAKGKFQIEATFLITGRGLVFLGKLSGGDFIIGDLLSFTANNIPRLRKIKGFSSGRRSDGNTGSLGLLIECENDEESEELRNWQPANAEALIYNQ